jgi:CRISPR-associated endonuclease/helicase Cas3
MQTPALLWAKKRGTKDDELWHPLLYHMLDVGVVAETLWDHAVHDSLRDFLISELGLPETEARAWLCFLTTTHDTGKASPAFQKLSDKAVQVLKAHGFPFEKHALPCKHGIITADTLAPLLQSFCHPTDFPLELGKTLALTVGGHHGVFVRNKSRPGQRGDDRAWSEARQEIVATLAQLFEVQRTAVPRNSKSLAFYILLAGLTCVADWIGSDERYFPYTPEEVDPTRYLALARQRAVYAVQSLGWSAWHPPTTPVPFTTLFPFITNPRPLQTATAALAPQLPGRASLVIVEAPMGEGKTEAAMFLADYWIATQQQQGCYFALPTQATSNQMFGRVQKFLRSRYPEQWVNTQLVHGAKLISEDFDELRLRTYPEESDGSPSGGITAEEWFLPRKRSLLAPFGVGTIDQALMAVLQTRHFFVRLFGLAHKTIIIDEVHAYDTYTSTLLERLLEWLGTLGCSVVLLSATLPACKRQALIQAFGGKQQPENALVAPYPRITWVSGDASGTVAFPATQQRQLALRHLTDNNDDLVQALRLVLGEGGCVAIVCNTVGRAQDVYQAIKHAQLVPPECLQLLHSRFPFAERDTRERQALDNFGKQGYRPHTAILVATQIIEQSLDLDFDLLITDLAPADLVLQRAGRLHRHDNPRPAPLASPMVWVRFPSVNDDQVPDFGPSARIYDRYTLLRSYLALTQRQTIQLPEDLEIIVEEVYGEKIAWPSPALQEAATAAKEKLNEEIRGEQFQAKGNLIASPHSQEEPDEILLQFSKNLEEDNPDVHQALQALTRLTEPSVQVVCLCATPTGDCLSSDGAVVNLKTKPTGSLTRALLRRALTITDKRVVFTLLKDEQCKPSGWKESSALRHHRVLHFEEGKTTIGRYTLHLDPELGLRITADDTE